MSFTHRLVFVAFCWMLQALSLGCGTERPPVGGGCPAGLALCGQACVDVASDATHCGACGHACGAASCINGFCSVVTASDGGATVDASDSATDAGAIDTCAPFATCVVGGATYCANLATDTANCGTCGTTCGSGGVCVAGNCVLQCPGSAARCAGTPDYCAELASDEDNCGACGMVCATGATCNQGACACPAGQTDLCAGACVSLATDEQNCGACATTCDTGVGERCLAGNCVCPGVQPSVCDGHCVDLANDAAHCGACANACPSATPYCASGTCTALEPFPAADLSAYWKMNGDGADALGGSDDAHVPGGPGTLTSQWGNFFGPGLSFDAGIRAQGLAVTNDFMFVNTSAIAVKATGYTFSLWFSSTRTTLGDLAACRAFALTINQFGAGTVTIQAGNASQWFYTTSASNGYTDGAWHHVVGRFDPASQTLSLTIDGETTTTTPSLTLSFDTTEYFWLGGDPWGGAMLDGVLDEVAFWNRSLSDDEVALLYRGGAGSFLP